MAQFTDSIKEKIRAILNLAHNSAAAEGEIANALAFAAKLMAEHQLSEADVAAGVDPEIELERAEMARQFVNGGGKACAWEFALAGYICWFVGGVSYYTSKGYHTNAVGGAILDVNGNRSHGQCYAFYGTAEDVRIATDLFADLRQTVMAMAKLRCGGVYRGEGRSYAEGFVRGLRERLSDSVHENRQLAITKQQEGKAGALVVVKKRQALVKAKKAKAEEWLVTSLGVRFGGRAYNVGHGQHHQDTYGKGREDGRKHDTTVNRTRKLTSG